MDFSHVCLSYQRSVKNKNSVFLNNSPVHSWISTELLSSIQHFYTGQNVWTQHLPAINLSTFVKSHLIKQQESELQADVEGEMRGDFCFVTHPDISNQNSHTMSWPVLRSRSLPPRACCTKPSGSSEGSQGEISEMGRGRGWQVLERESEWGSKMCTKT